MLYSCAAIYLIFCVCSGLVSSCPGQFHPDQDRPDSIQHHDPLIVIAVG